MTEAPTAAPRGQSERQGLEADGQAARMVAEALDLLRPSGGTLRLLDVSHPAGIGGLSGADEVVTAEPSEVEALSRGGDAGARLSADDGSFDFVVGVDAYADVAPEARERYLRELRRVARRGVLVAAPFETPALGGALRMASELRAGIEPASNGAPQAEPSPPSLDEAREILREEGDTVLVVGDGQLALWLFASCAPLYGAGADSGLADLVERVGSLSGELLGRRNGGPSYRHLLLSLREGEPADLDSLTAPAPGAGGEAVGSGLLATMAALLPLGAEIQSLQRRIAEYERRLAIRDGALARRDAQVKDLSRRLADAITLVEAEREEKQDLQGQLDRVVNTRAWRAIALQHRFRHWLWVVLSAPFRAIGRLFGRDRAQA